MVEGDMSCSSLNCLLFGNIALSIKQYVLGTTATSWESQISMVCKDYILFPRKKKRLDCTN